jgi:hypothetical protein
VTKVTLENQVLQEHKVYKVYRENKDRVVLKAIPESLARTVQTAQTANQDHKGSKDLEG